MQLSHAGKVHRAGGLAVLLVVLVMASSPVEAGAKKRVKASRTVSGTILDGNQNPIEGASVELKDTLTGKTIGIYSQAEGHYSFSDLNPNHDYELHAHVKDLSSDVRKVSMFDDRDSIVINLQIPPPKE